MAVPEKEVMHFATAAGDYEEYPNTNGTVVTSGQEKEVFYFKSERAAGTEEWEHVVELSSSCRECCYERCKGAQPFNSVEAALDHINDRYVKTSSSLRLSTLHNLGLIVPFACTEAERGYASKVR